MATLLQRETIRRQTKAFYISLRRYGANPKKALTLAIERARKLGSKDSRNVAMSIRAEIDPEFAEEGTTEEAQANE